MSTLSEILDRSTGIGPMKETQRMMQDRVEKLAVMLVNHETRLVRLETTQDVARLLAGSTKGKR